MTIEVHETSSKEPEYISINGRTLTICCSGNNFNKIIFKCEEKISVDIYTNRSIKVRTSTNIIPYPESCLTLDEVNEICRNSCSCCSNLDSYHSLNTFGHLEDYSYYIFIVINGVYIRDTKRSNEPLDRTVIFSEENFVPFTMTKSARSA